MMFHSSLPPSFSSQDHLQADLGEFKNIIEKLTEDEHNLTL